MKDKLEVGMYVRTNDGYIAKLIKKNETWKYEFDGSVIYEFDSQIWDTDYADNYYDETELFESEIEDLTMEPSFNIMDLIRKGDYVNGHKVWGFMIDNEKSVKEGIDEKVGVIVEGELDYIEYLTKDIKSILTKELYEEMEYQIGE